MEMYIDIALFAGVALAALAAAFAAGRIWQAARGLAGRIEALEADVQELKNHRLHPHPTRNGLEDALAIALDILQEEQASREYTNARMRQLSDVLRAVRADPHGYREGENQKKGWHERRK